MLLNEENENMTREQQISKMIRTCRNVSNPVLSDKWQKDLILELLQNESRNIVLNKDEISCVIEIRDDGKYVKFCGDTK